ncbi:MAG TPA: hypothetical protein VKB80_08230 [Kofleriaceae bacterium]|nr:hypothetical protein [Kofleriaceae bacterium]
MDRRVLAREPEADTTIDAVDAPGPAIADGSGPLRRSRRQRAAFADVPPLGEPLAGDVMGGDALEAELAGGRAGPPGGGRADRAGDHAGERAGAGLLLTLRLTDPDVLGELRRRSGAERDRFAAAALRVGVIALRSASGNLDADAVREAGHKLLADLRETLATRAAELTGEMARTLTQYFDPKSGLVPQRIDRLVRDGGDLERVMRSHVGDESILARTLAVHVGADSPLFKMLSPAEADGLRAQIEGALGAALREQSDVVLRQFSLDHGDSALSRLVRELRAHQGDLSRDLKGQVEAVVREFSLDKPDSVMSRLSGLLTRTQDEIGRNLSLDDDGSALARLRRELMTVVEEMATRNASFHSDVRATLSALDARKEEAARSTRHGATFEEALGGLLAAEAQRMGDIHQATGPTTGAIKNCKVGDHVVVMGPESSAPGAAIAFEAKEDRSCDLRAALAESERARKNRQAQVGVFVFSARSAPADLQPLARYGDDLVVLWDADDERTDLYVRLAYSVARCLTSRVAGAAEQNAEALLEIDLATRAIEKQVQFLDEVHKLAGTVKSHGERIQARMERMRDELSREVDRLDRQARALRADGVQQRLF